MAKIWSAVTTLTILFTLDLCLMDRTDESYLDVINLAKNSAEVPIFALSLGTLLAVFSSALMLGLIKRNSPLSRIDRIPPLWVDPTESQRFRTAWKCTIISITVVFPLGAQVHFWRRFHKWKAWVNDGTNPVSEISLYEPVSFKFILDWDAHRYGDLGRIAQEGWAGVSYLPLWQPILMVILSVVFLILAIEIMRRVLRR